VNGAGSELGKLTAWTGLEVFCLWRIRRAGRVSRAILVILRVIVSAELLVGQVRPWSWYGDGLLAIVVAQPLIGRSLT